MKPEILLCSAPLISNFPHPMTALSVSYKEALKVDNGPLLPITRSTVRQPVYGGIGFIL